MPTRLRSSRTIEKSRDKFEELILFYCLKDKNSQILSLKANGTFMRLPHVGYSVAAIFSSVLWMLALVCFLVPYY